MIELNKYPATLEEWLILNESSLQWYKDSYEFLKNVNLPIPYYVLKEYYIRDIEDRNFSPNQSIIENYSFLFSYYLDNFNKSQADKFSGNTTIGYLWNSLKSTPTPIQPATAIWQGLADEISAVWGSVAKGTTAIGDTASGVSKLFNPTYIIIILLMVLVGFYFFTKSIK